MADEPESGQLGAGRLDIAGVQLTVSPESQTVPFETPTTVATSLDGFAGGSLPPGLRVLAELSGPEIRGVLPLETVPGEPFRIPRLRLEGEYVLDDIRLVDGDELLAWAAPRSAAVRVTQVLVTRVSSRALTLDEIRSHGLVIGDDSFQAYNFTFGFGIDGESDVIDYNVPIGFVSRFGEPSRAFPLPGGSLSISRPRRFAPPPMAVFQLDLERPTAPEVPTGGCDFGDCRTVLPPPPPLLGVILFPADVRLLNQFFSVVLMAQNGAPAGDALVLRDLSARISVPSGLRQAETVPPTPLGVPVPVRSPGPDGELGTADDVEFLVAQATGQAEHLLEGLREGSHLVEFEINGLAEGPGIGVQRVSGRTSGAVVVRDPSLAVTLSHPDVVRADLEYTLRVTVTNTGTAPVNLATVRLNAAGLAGVDLVDDAEKEIEQLLPNDSETVEFELISRLTGDLKSATARSGNAISPVFEITHGIGSAGVPLAPGTIVLPRATEALPDELLRDALALIGLGHSLATAPLETLAEAGLPQLESGVIHERVFRLTQAGRHVALGEDLVDSLTVLAAEWTGAREPVAEWDWLRRRTDKGARFGEHVAAVLAAESAATSPRQLFDRFAATTHYLQPLHLALADGAGARLEVESLATGAALSSAAAGGPSRDLEHAELFDLGDAELALLAVPEEDGYRLRLYQTTGSGAALHLLAPATGGALRTVRWTGLALAAGAVATLEYRADDTVFELSVDDDGDGTVDRTVVGSVGALATPPLDVVAAVQNAEIDPSGHVVDLLLNADIEPPLPIDPSRFTLPGKVSNGGITHIEAQVAEGGVENLLGGLGDSRLVQVVFDNPLSPFVTQPLTVRDLVGVAGDVLVERTIDVVTTVSTDAGQVHGTIIGADGQPVAGAAVQLYEFEPCLLCWETGCKATLVAAVEADDGGAYAFDYVRQRSECADRFEIRARDPETARWGSSQGKMRFPAEPLELDVVMVGRGRVHGRVSYSDGSVPPDVRVTVENAVFGGGRLAHVDEEGYYHADEVIVGPVRLAATDGLGNVVYQTIELPFAGSTAERDLVILPSADGAGTVRGTTVDAAGQPVAGAFVGLYVGGSPLAAATSDDQGVFDFGLVPAGQAELEAFEASSGESGAQLFFEVVADQTVDLEVVLRDQRGTVQGFVRRKLTDGTVVPVAGVVVYIQQTPFNTVTDATGFYRLDEVFAGDRQVVAGDVERGLSVSAPVTVADGVVADQDLLFVDELDNGGISGVVLDRDGQPMSATIHLAGGYHSLSWHHEVSTDEDGLFTIPDLGPGTYGVHAFNGQDGALQLATIRFPGDNPFVELRVRRATLRGRTMQREADGTLIGVPSLLTYRHTVVENAADGLVVLAFKFNTLLTDSAGYYEIPDVLVGPYELHAYNAFAGDDGVQHATGELVFDGEVREHDFVFEPNGDIHGVVLDFDAVTPVAGATVSLTGGGFSSFEISSDVDGAFHFPLLPEGGYWIEVTADDGSVFRQAIAHATLGRPGDRVDIEVVLPQQGSVVGFVEDSNQNPVPGAVVTLQERTYPYQRRVQNADEEGNFQFDNIFVGEVGLSAQAPSLGGLGGRVTVELTGEGDLVSTAITLEDTGEIEATVLSPVDGLPVENARVYVRAVGRFVDSDTTDADGRVRFRLLPLDGYWLEVFDPFTGRQARSETFEITANGEVAAVEVVLEARGEVDGHLVDPESGQGVPAQTVRLVSRGVEWIWTYASTDADGYFEFLGIPEGEFTLSAEEAESRRKARGAGEITAEDERVTVDLAFEAVSRVFGRVLNPPGATAGLFPEPVNVYLKQQGDVTAATFDNPFDLDGVRSRIRFSVYATELGGDHRTRAFATIWEEDQDLELDLQMQAIGSLTVEVRDSFGAPVAGADVRASSHGLFGVESFQGGTGDDHLVSFTGVEQGSVEARATDPLTGLRGSASGVLELEGENVQLHVTLEDVGTIRGRVLLADGATPAADAVVAVVRDSPINQRYQTILGEDGIFEIDSVPMGGYTLHLQEHEGPGRRELRGALTANGEVADHGDLVLDDRDPYVVSFSPATGSRDLPVETQIVVTFSEPMSTVEEDWIVLSKIDGGFAWADYSWSADQTTVTLTPVGGLASATGYNVDVNTHLRDLAGRHISWPARTSFYTADVIPPAVIDVLPRDGADQVPVDTQLVVTFSEPVDLASLSGTALELYDLTTGAGVGISPLLRANEREVVITPHQDLSPDRQLRLTVQGVTDGAGIAMTAPFVMTFWTPDETPPEISWVAPAHDALFTAGDEIAAEVAVTDNRGVASVEYVLPEWSVLSAAAPYSASFPAPYVAASGTVPITAIATDIFGNTAEAVRDVQIDALTGGDGPTLAVRCLQDGDLVLAGEPISIPVTIEDDLAVESYELVVDGAIFERHAPVGQPSVAHTFVWTPPSGALPDDPFALEVRARDFAGNVAVHASTLAVAPATTLFGDQDLDATSDGTALVLGTGTYTATEALAPAALTLLPGAVLTDADGVLELGVAGTVRVQCTAVLDVSGGGFAGSDGYPAPGAAPAGLTGSQPGAGGSHGGAGATSYEPAGEVYGSVYFPSLGGGGGSQGDIPPTDGADGGGVVWLTAAELILEGEIQAFGDEGSGAVHAGAGGSVLVDVDRLVGGGAIDARGGLWQGNCPNSSPVGGAGGGGRVALYADVLDGFDPVLQALPAGGPQQRCNAVWGHAAPGTLFWRTASHDVGELRLDTGAEPSPSAPVVVSELPALGTGTVVQLDADGGDAWVTTSEALRPRWLGAWMLLTGAGGEALGTFRVLEVDAAGRALLEGAGAVVGAASYAGEYRFDQIVLAGGAKLHASDPVDADAIELGGESTLPEEVFAGSVTILAGATVTPAAAGDLRFFVAGDMTVEDGAVIAAENLRLEVDGVLTVGAGAVLDVTGGGYEGSDQYPEPGGAPAGVAPSQVGAGGSHGGAGATGLDPAGEVYGSVYFPALGGGGGSQGDIPPTDGADGGGVVSIEATEMILEGEILARGEEGLSGLKAGAGGTVTIEVGVLSGTGSIAADGGEWRGSCGQASAVDGSGGGGRVALLAGVLDGFDPEVHASAAGGSWGNCGPAGYAAPGTVFIFTAASTYGSLIIDARPPVSNRPIETAELPSIGRGVVGAVTADAGTPGALWIEPEDSTRTFSVGVVGMWVRVAAGDYRVLAERADRRGVLLEGADGAVTVGEPFVGVYKLDELRLAGGVDLELDDADEVTSEDIEEGSTLHRQDLTPPTVDLTTPADGAAFTSGDAIAIVFTASDDKALADIVVTFGERTRTFTEGPFEWTIGAPAVTASADLELRIEARDAEDNLTVVTRTVHVDPYPTSAPPQVAFVCPEFAPTLAPGTGLDLAVDATSAAGIERVELFLDAATEPFATLWEAPFDAPYTVPATAPAGTPQTVRAVARSYTGETAEVSLVVTVVDGAVLADATVAAGDTSYDGLDVFVVPGTTGTTTIEGAHAFASLRVLDGATLTTVAGGLLELDVAGAFHLACGGRVDLDGVGYPGTTADPELDGVAAPPAVGAAPTGVGGSHGGEGTGGYYQGGPPAEVYDSVYLPRFGGGGGGYAGNFYYPGGTGGGRLHLAAGEVQLSGAISARGAGGIDDEDSWRAGTGAGGTVVVDTASLAGSGTLDVSGGDYQRLNDFLIGGSQDGRGGVAGGGRVALYADAFAGFDPAAQVTARGGKRFKDDEVTVETAGAAGTVYVFGPGATWGELIIDADLPGGGAAVTDLPALGSGVLSLVEADVAEPQHAWVEGDLASPLFALGGEGMWLRVDGVEYRVLEQSADRRRLLLEGAAGAVAAGDLYRGLYRFDHVAVRGGAGLRIADAGEVATTEVAADATLEIGDSTPPQLADVEPADGSLFYSGLNVPASATASDDVGVTEVRFHLAGATLVDSEAPYAATFVAPEVTAPTDYILRVEAFDAAGNVAVVEHDVTVDEAPGGGPPELAIVCPTPGALLAPGTGLDLHVEADHPDGIDSVELFVDGAATPAQTLLAPPWVLRLDAPPAAADGDVLSARVVATGATGSTAELTLPVGVVAGAVFTADAELTAADLSLEGQSVIVAGGTLTVAGEHGFRDLVVLDGATVSHLPTQAPFTADPALVGYWPFDDEGDPTASVVGPAMVLGAGAGADANDPAFVCDPAVRAPRAGNACALEYTGYNDPSADSHALIPHAPELDFSGEYTVAMWLRLDDVSDPFRPILIRSAGGPNGADDGYDWLFWWSTGISKLYVHIGNGSGGNSSNVSFPEPPRDQLVHVALVYAAGKLHVYYDGVAQSPAAGWSLGAPPVNGFDWQLGWINRASWNSPAGSGRIKYFDGVFDELYFFDRALAVGEVAVLAAPSGDRLDLTVERDVFVACGGAVEADGLGFAGGDPFGSAFPSGTVEGAAAGVGGSHGGRGGAFDGSGRIYGNLFDPAEAGGGGGGAGATAGGGIVRIAAGDELIVDGAIRARGGESGGAVAHGAGGSIRLDAATLAGVGSVDASGAGTAAAGSGGGGGRIALYGATIDAELLGRTHAQGGDGADAASRGAAGTVFVRRDGDVYGELIIDDGGLASAQLTVLPAIGSGVVDAVTADTVTDAEADFVHSLVGLDVAFDGDESALWTVVGNEDHGDTLTLDVSAAAHPAQPGDPYHGVLRLDRLTVRDAVVALTRDSVDAATVDVDPGSAWHPGYTPSLTITQPADGASLTSGETVTIAATVDALTGVDEVRLRFGGLVVSGGEAPYTWDLMTPFVAQAETVAIELEATLVGGGTYRTAIDVQVDPGAQGSAPSATMWSCEGDGGWLAPGESTSLDVVASDPDGIDAYNLVVNGELGSWITAGGSPTDLSLELSWTMPSTASSGAMFELVLLVRDVAGHLGHAGLSLHAGGGELSGDQTLDASFDGQDLVLGTGLHTVTEPLQVASLRLLSGAVLTGSPGAPLELSVTGVMAVQCGASVDLAGKGYPGGTSASSPTAPPGVVAATQYAGGGHGGAGTLGYSAGSPGEGFDSVYLPRDGGGGGGYYLSNQPGGAGGGALRLDAGAVIVNGTIAARGESPAVWAGAGAGGGVTITAATLRGTGSIDASGGDYPRQSSDYGGVGGGGRVALWVEELMGFDPVAQVTVAGGRLLATDGTTVEDLASPGTVFVFTADSTYGDLVTPSSSDGEMSLPSLGEGVVAGFEVAGGDAWITGPAAFLGRWLGAWMVLEDAGGAGIGTFRVASIDATGRALLEGAAPAGAAASYRGEYRFDEVRLTGTNLGMTDPLVAERVELAGDAGAPPLLRATTVDLLGGTHAAPGPVEWTVTGTLTLAAGATLELDGAGFPGGTSASSATTPPGASAATLSAGGGHGGAGTLGYYSGSGGAEYGSLYLPSAAGGGGGYYFNAPGGGGGGLLTLEAGVIVLDGAIIARGASPGVWAGAGAGGGVVITAASLSGAGTIDVSGGDYQKAPSDYGGLGGGGRVALYVDDLTGFDVATQASAAGGRLLASGGAVEDVAAPGTVFVFDASAVYGEVFVESGVSGLTVPATALPAIGSGTVGTVTVDTEDPAAAWIEPSDTAHVFAVGVSGAWLRIGGVDYRIVAESADGGSVLLAGAAGAVSVGDAFVGVYKLDDLHETGGADLTTTDVLEVTDQTAAAQGEPELVRLAAVEGPIWFVAQGFGVGTFRGLR